MQTTYGIPFFEGSFYGVTDTSAAFREFAKLIGDAALSARVETMIVREEAKIDDALAACRTLGSDSENRPRRVQFLTVSPGNIRNIAQEMGEKWAGAVGLQPEIPKSDRLLEPWRTRLRGKRVQLYTGGVKSWSIVSALQVLGMEVVATGTNKSTEEDRARIREIMGEKTKMITDGSPKALLGVVAEYQADILIAGGRNMYTALKARVPFLDINQEREFAYAGYTGMLELARQLALAIESPVWAAVKKPPPWSAKP